MADKFNVTLKEFMTSVLQQLMNNNGIAGNPGTPVIDFMISWAHSEGGSVTNDAHFNPLNTMQEEQGSVDFATQQPGPGVQAYPDATTGEKATLDALNNGHYKNLVHALATGDEQGLGLSKRGAPTFAFMMNGNIAQELSLWSGHGGDIIAAQQYIVGILQGAGISNASIQGGRIVGGPGQSKETIDTWGGAILGQSATGTGNNTSSWTSNDLIKVGLGILMLLIGSALFIKAQYPGSGIGKLVGRVIK
jgi:hypothetical protein